MRGSTYGSFSNDVEAAAASSSSALEKQEPVNVDDNDDDTKELVEERVPVTAWMVFPFMGLLVIFSVPSMTYSLYKQTLMTNLALTPKESGDIVSCGLLGGMVLGFIPGLLYDRLGYAGTVLVGGVLNVGGSFLWYMQLTQGGSATWYGLAVSLAIICHGCRWHYFAGVCGSLGAFPARWAGTVGATMAVLVSMGYIILPKMWTSFFLPASNDLQAWTAGPNPTLRTVQPVADFWLWLGFVYLAFTILALASAGWVPRPSASGSGGGPSLMENLGRIRDPAAVSLVLMVALSLGWLYAFMTNGLGTAALTAKVSTKERGYVVMMTGIVGLISRTLHGVGSDLLRKSPAGRASSYLAYLCASLCALLGFSAMSYGMRSPESTFPHVWKPASYLLAAGFGGLFALFPASTRVVFSSSAMSLWLGILCSLTGSLNFIYSRVGVAMSWDATCYAIAAAASATYAAFLLGMVVKSWGPE